MRLSDVRAGMQCKGLSVVRGTAISQFDVEVIDVISGDSAAPGRAHPDPRLRARRWTPPGVGPGFSGLPDHLPGLPTACSATRARSPRASASSATRSRWPRRSSRSSARRPEAGALGAQRAAPCAAAPGRSPPRSRCPASRRASGCGSCARARRAGAQVLAAPGGPARRLPGPGPAPGLGGVRGLAGGDLAIGSIGTVAYRDGSAIWAFGHPLDAAGRRALPLQDAYVFSVINNPNGTEEAITTKLAVPGPHRSAASPSTGSTRSPGGSARRRARSALRVAVREHRQPPRARCWSSDVTDERELELGSSLDLVGALAVSQATDQVLGSAPAAPLDRDVRARSGCASAAAGSASATPTRRRSARSRTSRARSGWSTASSSAASPPPTCRCG